MIQRIQTLYLLVALLLTVLCLCLPVAAFEPVGMGGETLMLNLWEVDPDGLRTWDSWPLFAILLLSCPLCIFAICSYKNRKRQAALCTLCLLLNVAWVVVYAALFYLRAGYEDTESSTIRFAACLPVISIILYYMARRGVKHDDKLIRDMDRIR
ncbi:MAG: DUF4293 domain-containing protein [Prevotella sp.]|nr:DUF4293 domain-containing protein [Prevotella sp.]